MCKAFFWPTIETTEIMPVSLVYGDVEGWSEAPFLQEWKSPGGL